MYFYNGACSSVHQCGCRCLLCCGRQPLAAGSAPCQQSTVLCLLRCTLLPHTQPSKPARRHWRLPVQVRRPPAVQRRVGWRAAAATAARAAAAAVGPSRLKQLRSGLWVLEAVVLQQALRLVDAALLIGTPLPGRGGEGWGGEGGGNGRPASGGKQAAGTMRRAQCHLTELPSCMLTIARAQHPPHEQAIRSQHLLEVVRAGDASERCQHRAAGAHIGVGACPVAHRPWERKGRSRW